MSQFVKSSEILDLDLLEKRKANPCQKYGGCPYTILPAHWFCPHCMEDLAIDAENPQYRYRERSMDEMRGILARAKKIASTSITIEDDGY
jgi:hypothetical protein